MTGMRWCVPGRLSSCPALRSGSPSGATRSSTCQMSMASHGRSASPPARSSIGGVVVPPDRASVRPAAGAHGAARRREIESAARRAGSSSTRTDSALTGGSCPIDRRCAQGRGSTVTLGGYTAEMTATTGVGTDGGGGAMARSWRDPLGRAGMVARGVLYVVLGLLAIQFARGDTSSDQVNQTGAIRDGGRAAVRQGPAGRADAGADRALRVAADPDVRRRPGRG